jgi:hypothetical protein
MKFDKRIVEVGNDLVSAGSDAASVLNNIPSVNVDQQTGALSLRGNEKFCDGKPSSQSAAQLLKQILRIKFNELKLLPILQQI